MGRGVKAGVKATLTPYQRVTSTLCHMEGDVSVLLPRFPDNYGLNPGCYLCNKKYRKTPLGLCWQMCPLLNQWVKYAIPIAASQPIHPEALLSGECRREQPLQSENCCCI